MTAGVSRTVLLLARAEAEIALIDKTRPLEFASEFQRLLGVWERGQHEAPILRYAPRRKLTTLKRELSAVIEPADCRSCDSEWLAARAEELLLEARMAEAVGTAAFGALARARFSPPQGKLAATLESMARAWIGEGAGTVRDEPTFRSDDRMAPLSLWSMLAQRIGQLHLPVRLRVDDALVSLAACGQDVIVIRGNAWLTTRAAARITEHEIAGHLLPRVAGRARSDVLRCGCAGATDDEEGRALLIERRLGLLDPWRRAELGARHLACVHLRDGATFVEVVRSLVALGAPLESALRSMLRAQRGGGLAREIVYLQALQRLEHAFAARPELEQWFLRGRASLAYAVSRQVGVRAA